MAEESGSDLIRAGFELYEKRQLKAALQKLRAGLRAGYDAPSIHLDISAVLIDLERQGEARDAYRVAEEALTQAINDPSDRPWNIPSQLHNDRGVARALIGHLAPALDDFETAVGLREGWFPAALKSRGRVLLALGDYDASRRALEEAISQLDDGRAHYWLARTLIACGDKKGLPRAVSELRHAIERGERRSLTYLWLARTLRMTGDDSAAVEKSLQYAARVCQRDIVKRRNRPLSRYILGHVRLDSRDFAGAEQTFLKSACVSSSPSVRDRDCPGKAR